MDLEFSLPEVAAVVASVHVTAQVCNDGESNWFEGLQMLGVYLVIGVLFFFLPETH
jgi:Ca2+:H+ antiporter